MRLTKKVLAVLLAVLAIVVLTALPVSAEEDQYVWPEIIVEDVSKPVVGDGIDLWMGYAQGNAEIISRTWLVYEVGGTTPVYVIDQDTMAAWSFEEGYTYTWIGEVQLYWGIVDSTTVATVNGKSATIEDNGDGTVTVTCDLGEPIVLNDIESIDIAGIIAPVAGAQSVLEGISAPEGANYTIEYAYWRDRSNDVIHGTDPITFAKTGDYELTLRLKAAEGYAFMYEWDMADDSICASVGADAVNYSRDGAEYAWVQLFFYADDADVTLVAPALESTEPAVGDDISVDWIKLPQGVEGYHIRDLSMYVYDAEGNYLGRGAWYHDPENGPSVYWENANYELVESLGKHQAGYFYEVEVYMAPDTGYVFANSQKTEDLIVNGEVSEQGYVERTSAYARVQLCYTVVDEVIIEGIQAPVPGQTVTFEGVQVPEGAPYQIVSLRWYENYLGAWKGEYAWYEGEISGEAFQFKAFHDYSLEIEIRFNDTGVTVSEKVTVNAGDLNCTDSYNNYWGGNWMYASFTWEADRDSFSKVVPAVDGLEAPAVGGTPDLDVTVPAGTVLQRIEWFVYDEDGNAIASYGKVLENGEYVAIGEAFTFEENVRYTVSILIQPENGKLFEEGLIAVNGSTDYIGQSGAYGGEAFVEIYYGFEMLDKVELTGVTKPEIGKPATFEGITCITEGVDIFYMYWRECDELGEVVKEYSYYAMWDEYYGEEIIFREGHDYMLYVQFNSQNKLMSEELTITFNGAEAESVVAGVYASLGFVQYQADGSEAVILDQVAVEGVKAPFAGQTATFEGIKLPASMKGYKILALGWVEVDENGEPVNDGYIWYHESMDMEAEGAPFKFEEGKKYMLAVICGRELGYVFSANCQPMIDGVKAELPEESASRTIVTFYMEYSVNTADTNPPTGDSFGVIAPVVMLLAVTAMACLAWNRKKFLA